MLTLTWGKDHGILVNTGAIYLVLSTKIRQSMSQELYNYEGIRNAPRIGIHRAMRM